MKKATLFLIIITTLMGCKKTVSPLQIHLLNGYWEIAKVEKQGTDPKTYPVNTNVDYIFVENNKGYRQKMMPLATGKYQSNGLKEQITVEPNNNGKLLIKCQTQYATWVEEIIELSPDSYTMKNPDGIIYHYKKYKPISIEHLL